MRITGLFALLALLSVPAFAANIDGKWTGSIDTPNGPVQLTYVFASKGTELTGTAAGPDGNATPLEHGKIEGDKVSFSLTFNFGQTMTFAYTGTLSGKELKLHSDMGGGIPPIDFTLTKAN
jgi:hypothetical protein